MDSETDEVQSFGFLPEVSKRHSHFLTRHRDRFLPLVILSPLRYRISENSFVMKSEEDSAWLSCLPK